MRLTRAPEWEKIREAERICKGSRLCAVCCIHTTSNFGGQSVALCKAKRGHEDNCCLHIFVHHPYDVGLLGGALGGRCPGALTLGLPHPQKERPPQ